jgi:hypothetical protein
MNVAIFISGRLLGYKEFLIPTLEKLKDKYNIKLFLSINSDIDYEACQLLNEYKGEFYFKPYKMPLSYVLNRISNNINTFQYNQLSMFFNDYNNFLLIDKYEKDNNISFDIICKLRADIKVISALNFIKDDILTKKIRFKHICQLKHWGHLYHNTPEMISDAFAYGNKISMQKYTNVYFFTLQADIEKKGTYTQPPEVALTDGILKTIMYNIPGGGYKPQFTEQEIINIYNSTNIEFIIQHDVHYIMLDTRLRCKNNIEININNVNDYTDVTGNISNI